MKFPDIEKYYLDVVMGRKQGLMAEIFKKILFLFSLVYYLVIAFRNYLFDHRWLSVYYPPVSIVISVGNLTAGGSGKTPVTMMLLEALKEKGQLGVLSRGYRSPAEHFGEPVILCQGHGPHYPASYCGDEPYMMAVNYPEAFIYVGADRQASGRLAAKQGVDLLILDDGMQHRRLHRDFNIVVLDSMAPLSNGYLLPRGLLREPPSSLKRAELLIFNHVRDAGHFEEAVASLRKYTDVPAIGVAPGSLGIFTTQGEEIPKIDQMKVGLFCGIAAPQYFRQMVTSCGAEIVAEEISSDHQVPEPVRLAAFADQCKQLGAKMLICTEKDRVKLRETFSCSLPIAWVKMGLVIVAGQEVWQEFITTLIQKLAREKT